MKAAHKTKILVVDDDVDIGNMVKMILEYKGFDVIYLEKAEQAKEIMRNNAVELLILDMLLSGVNGTEICAELKSDPVVAHIPVIMMSAHPDAKNICIDAGADDFMSKPFDLQEMLGKIDYCITQSRTLNN